ncbi:MAG: hypothetical protein ACOVKL_07910 [Polynucleobacter sp.]
MSKVLKEITIIAGQYKNKEGAQKNRYQRIGSIVDTKNGDMLKLDQLPLIDGGWNGWAYINEPRQQDDAPKSRPTVMDDDVPFN